MLSPKKPFPDRWWYTPTLRNTRWGTPAIRVYRSGDEYCNDTLFVRIPLLGSLTIRIGKTIRLQGCCEECEKRLGPWCEGCQTPHHGPRCHNWINCPHAAKIRPCPTCGGMLCPDCEPKPATTCPRQEKQP